MVRSASWRLRQNTSIDILGQQLLFDDVVNAIGGSIHDPSSRQRGNLLLQAVDSVAKCVPHTTEASKRARRIAEAHQLVFLDCCP